MDLQPDMVGAAPPKPDLTSLCYNAKVKTAEGLPSLRVPDKIMTAWHDHATFGGEFKQWLTECEANAIPINLKETESQNTKRAAAGQGENPSGQKRGGRIGCTPMGNPYINGCLIPRIRRGHNKYHGYIVRGAPNCPLIEEVVQRLIKTRVFFYGFYHGVSSPSKHHHLGESVVTLSKQIQKHEKNKSWFKIKRISSF